MSMKMYSVKCVNTSKQLGPFLKTKADKVCKDYNRRFSTWWGIKFRVVSFKGRLPK